MNFRILFKLILLYFIGIVILSSCTEKKISKKENEKQAALYVALQEENEKYNDNVHTLYTALHEKDVYKLTNLYKSGFEKHFDEPLLFIAAYEDWDEGVIALINNGADLYCRSVEGKVFFNTVVNCLQEETAIDIINNGFNIMKLSDDEIKEVFRSAISVCKIKLQKRLLEVDDLIEKIIQDEELSKYFVWYWTDGTEEIVEELIKKDFLLPNDGSLYYHAINDNSNYKAIEWLLNHDFTITVPFEGETIKYWADLNFSRSRKQIGDSGPPPEDSIEAINAIKIKELIDNEEKRIMKKGD